MAIRNHVPKTQLIYEEQDLVDYFEGVSDLLVFDSETTGLSIDDLVIMFSFYDFVRPPVSVILNNIFTGISESSFVKICNKYFPKFEGIGHNLKFDLGVTKRMGIVDMRIHADTIIMLHCYDVDLKKQLEFRVKADFKYAKPTYKEIINKSWDKIDWVADLLPSIDKKTGEERPAIITAENMGEYAGQDVYWTAKLYEKYLPLMTEEMLNLLTRIEYPLVITLRDMFHTGINVDVSVLEKIDEKIVIDMKRAESNIYKLAGSVFNINSGKQKGEVLYDRMHLPVYGKTKGGARSTDSGVLDRLAEDGHEIAEHMVKYSELQKLQSGYTRSIPQLIDGDGRLRCSFNQDGTRTSRLSSNRPNLQNQPNNSKYPIRASFIPSDGCKLIVADMSQIEPRIMAHISQDKKMLEIYNGELGDIYQGIANELGITRKEAKVVQLGISYGMGPDKLAKGLGISKREAEAVIERYYGKYIDLRKWKIRTEKAAAAQCCVYTMFGRIRRLPELKNPDNKSFYFGGLRKAINTSIQSPAADMIKMSMTRCADEFAHRNMQSKLLLTVHDELVVDAPFNEIEEAYAILIDAMENTYKLSVPCIAEGKVVDSWDNMKSNDFISLLPNYIGQLKHNRNFLNYLWL